MSKQNTVAVAVKTALNVGSIESIASKFLAMGKRDKENRDKQFSANQAVALDLNSYFLVQHGIAKWETQHVRSPATQSQRIVRDTYDCLKKQYDKEGYKGFAAKFGQAKLYAPAMRLEGEARLAALAVIQQARSNAAESRTVDEVYTYRMKDGKKEWGTLAALYKTTARFYFASDEQALKAKMNSEHRKLLSKTMANLGAALRDWGIDPDLLTAESTK